MNTRLKNEELSLGDFLKSHREGEELSQTEMASLLNISRQRLCDLEKNRKPVSLKLCKELASKLEVPVEFLAKLSIQEQLNKEGISLSVV